MNKISIFRIGALLVSLLFVYWMFTVDKMMIWLAYAAALLAFPRKKHSKLSNQWYYTAFGLLCFGYFSGEDMWGNLGLLVATISFSSLTDGKKK